VEIGKAQTMSFAIRIILTLLIIAAAVLRLQHLS
jgi:hypothetical protein